MELFDKHDTRDHERYLNSLRTPEAQDVASKLVPGIIAFRLHWGCEEPFTLSDLERALRAEKFAFAPGSPGRIMRAMKVAGMLKYKADKRGVYQFYDNSGRYEDDQETKETGAV